MPFFVLHGEADIVTDPEVSRALYEQASSIDKTIKLYPGMWHGLTSGEPDDNIEIVFSDITAWLDKRSDNGNTNLAEFLGYVAVGAHFVRSAPTTPLMSMRTAKKKQPTRAYGKYFCGWKGTRMHHHPAA